MTFSMKILSSRKKSQILRYQRNFKLTPSLSSSCCLSSLFSSHFDLRKKHLVKNQQISCCLNCFLCCSDKDLPTKEAVKSNENSSKMIGQTLGYFCSMVHFVLISSCCYHSRVSLFAEEVQLYRKTGIQRIQPQKFTSTQREACVNYKGCSCTKGISNL